MNIKTIVTPNSLTVVQDGVPRVLTVGHAMFEVAKKHVRNKNFKALLRCFDVQKFTRGKAVVKDGKVFYNGEPVHNVVVDRILFHMREGLSYQPLLRFLEKLLLNSDPLVRENLYKFLETGHMPLCEDGDFLAYKGVSPDYTDCHTGTILNAPGCHPERLSLDKVNPDPDSPCSYGYHIGSYQYAKGFVPDGGHLMQVKANPADVGCVPNETSYGKVRCTYYEVVGEVVDGKPMNMKKIYKVKDNLLVNSKPRLPKRDMYGRFVSANGT